MKYLYLLILFIEKYFNCFYFFNSGKYCNHPGILRGTEDLICHILQKLGSVEQISELDFDHPNILTPEPEENIPENIV